MAIYRYAWPASGLTPEDMKALFAARQTAANRTTITQLVREAVRKAYCRPSLKFPAPQPPEAA